MIVIGIISKHDVLNDVSKEGCKQKGGQAQANGWLPIRNTRSKRTALRRPSGCGGLGAAASRPKAGLLPPRSPDVAFSPWFRARFRSTSIFSPAAAPSRSITAAVAIDALAEAEAAVAKLEAAASRPATGQGAREAECQVLAR